MLKRAIFVLITGLMLALPGMARAQGPEPAWRVTLLDLTTGALSHVTPLGVEPGPVISPIATYEYLPDAILTPDGRYFIYQAYTPATSGSETTVFVADLATGDCCRELQHPSYPQMSINWLGPLSPDGTQIVLSMADAMSVYGNQPNVSQVAVFDVASGALVASLPTANLTADYPAPAAHIGGWEADGIRLTPTCIACEGVWRGQYQIWNPVSGTLSDPTEPFDIFLRELPATGEFIAAVEDTSFPTSGLPGGYFPVANIVGYFTAPDASPQPVFFDPLNKVVIDARWVYDGNAVVVTQGGPLVIDEFGYPGSAEGGDAFLLFRDGQQVPLVPDAANVLHGTPDGWLSYDEDTGALGYHRVQPGGIVESVTLGFNVGSRVVGTSFELGTGASGAFPTVSPPAPVTCPDFMPSRLSANTVGWVTPGPDNNLRAEPTASSAQLGTIPGSQSFLVLEGPVCAESMAWWRVNYKGTIGWTSEGLGSSYWLEPMPSF